MRKLLVLLLFICLECSLFAEKFEEKFYPSITSVQKDNSKSILTLSDGSVWETETPLPKWKPRASFLIRWDNEKSSYFFDNPVSNQKIYATLIGVPNISVKKIKGDEIELSNGNRYKFLPFIDKVNVGDWILISLNENPAGNTHPYFMVGYDPLSPTPKMTGEIQAQLIN